MSQPQPPYGPPPGQPGSGATPTGPGPAAPYAPPAPGHGPAPFPYGVAQGHGGPTGPYTGAAETEPKAVVALVLAVLANTPLVPFVGAIAALVLARWAKRDIDRSGGAKTGRGLATAATVLAVLHLVFVALLFVGVLVLLALGVALPFL